MITPDVMDTAIFSLFVTMSVFCAVGVFALLVFVLLEIKTYRLLKEEAEWRMEQPDEQSFEPDTSTREMPAVPYSAPPQ